MTMYLLPLKISKNNKDTSILKTQNRHISNESPYIGQNDQI